MYAYLVFNTCRLVLVKLKFYGTDTDTDFLADFRSSRGSRRGLPWHAATVGPRPVEFKL